MPDSGHRERILTALRHGIPDRLPVDVGGSYATGVNVAAYDAWKHSLGLQTPTVTASRRSQIAEVEESVRQRFGIDTVPILPRGPRQPPEVMLADGAYQDEWGVVRSRPHEGHYYVSHEPLAAECSPSILAAYPWPDPDDPGYLDGLQDEAIRARASGRAVMLGLPVGLLHQATFLRGMANLMMDLLADRSLAENLLDRILEIHLTIAARMLDEVGDLVDVVMFADDQAANDRPFMSPALYRSVIKPRQRRYLQLVHSHTHAPVVYHTCGAVYPLVGDLVEIGVDVLNPVQVSAAGMDPVRLKREFGRDLCFWGGVDVATVLPCATPEETKSAVRGLVEALGPDGYVVSATNNIQADARPQNITAMLEAAGDCSLT